MRVSYDWLKTMIDIPEDPKTLSDEYIRTGTEVEAIDTVGESFDHVVTAKVLTKTPHPDSDHMYVCSVDVGDKNLDADGNPAPLQIVCGAQNFEAGDHIVTAMIGRNMLGKLLRYTYLPRAVQAYRRGARGGNNAYAWRQGALTSPFARRKRRVYVGIFRNIR